MAAVDGFLKANKAVAVVVSDKSYGGTDPSDARKLQTISLLLPVARFPSASAAIHDGCRCHPRNRSRQRSSKIK
jgi:hypothetical protein